MLLCMHTYPNMPMFREKKTYLRRDWDITLRQRMSWPSTKQKADPSPSAQNMVGARGSKEAEKKKVYDMYCVGKQSKEACLQLSHALSWFGEQVGTVTYNKGHQLVTRSPCAILRGQIISTMPNTTATHNQFHDYSGVLYFNWKAVAVVAPQHRTTGQQPGVCFAGTHTCRC